MNTATKNQTETISGSRISRTELENIAASLPVKSNVRAGLASSCPKAK